MKRVFCTLLLLISAYAFRSAYALGAPGAPGTSGAGQTPTGIPIDTEWKRSLIAYAQANVVHPSWGFAHSERDYQVSLALARAESVEMDPDVLFACAFLHDLGGIGGFAQAGVDHAVRSAELAPPLLQAWGFPMEKWPAVREMILGHTYYGPVPASPSARIFRDADVLDFTGVIGVARILAVTEEPGRPGRLATTVDLLRKFSTDMPLQLLFTASQLEGNTRVSEMKAYLERLDSRTFQGKAL